MPPAGIDYPNYFVFLTISNQCSGMTISRGTFFMYLPPGRLLIDLATS